jgi:AraC-like DNA-binding protein
LRYIVIKKRRSIIYFNDTSIIWFECKHRNEQFMSQESNINFSILKKPIFTISDYEPLSGGINPYSRPGDPSFDMHYPVEMGVVLTGRMQRIYPQYTEELGPGQIWFSAIWEPHGCAIVKAPCSILINFIWPPMLARMRFDEAPLFDWLAPFNVPSAQRPQVSGAKAQKMLTLANEMAERYLSTLPHAMKFLRLRTQLMEMLLLAADGWTAPDSRPTPEIGDSSAISRAVELVFRRSTFVSAASAAKECGMSRAAFDRSFSGLMGTSFREFGLNYRLSGAASQLLAGSDPVKAVAYKWGFRFASNLDRCFRKQFGCTPAEFRAQYHQGNGSKNSGN